MKLASRYKMGPIFTPPVVSKWEGPLGTLMLPNVTGGANWQGGSFDPETEHLLHLHQHRHRGRSACVARDGEQSDMRYVRGAARSEPGRHASGGRRWR